MKTTKKLLAIFIVAATMMFAACSEKENNPVSVDLSGTSWEATIDNVYNYQGIVDMIISGVMSMDFTSSTAGELYTNVTVSVPDIPGNDQTMDDTEEFTYTFDGTTLTLTSTGEDATTGDNGTMTYNAGDKTFTMIIPDESYEGMNLRDLYGSDRVVFRLVRGTVNF